MATKVSDTSAEFDKVVPEVRTKVTHERGFIESQIVAITAQRDAYVAQRNVELKECEDILKEMDVLGIVSKPVEAPNQEPLEG